MRETFLVNITSDLWNNYFFGARLDFGPIKTVTVWGGTPPPLPFSGIDIKSWLRDATKALFVGIKQRRKWSTCHSVCRTCIKRNGRTRTFIWHICWQRVLDKRVYWNRCLPILTGKKSVRSCLDKVCSLSLSSVHCSSQICADKDDF